MSRMETACRSLTRSGTVNTPDLEHPPQVEPELDSDNLPSIPLTPDVPHSLVKDPAENPPPRRYPLRIRHPPDRYK